MKKKKQQQQKKEEALQLEVLVSSYHMPQCSSAPHAIEVCLPNGGIVCLLHAREDLAQTRALEKDGDASASE